MTSTMIYWLLMLDNIREMLSLITILSALGSMGLGIGQVFSWCDGDKPPAMLKKMTLWSVIVFAIFGSLFVFTPSTKQACVIYLAPKVINNEQVQKVPENILKLLNAKMEQWIDEQTGTEAEAETKGE